MIDSENPRPRGYHRPETVAERTGEIPPGALFEPVRPTARVRLLVLVLVVALAVGVTGWVAWQVSQTFHEGPIWHG